MGVPAEQIEAAREGDPAAEEPEDCAVWAWHWPAVRLFQGMATQWRTSFEYGRRWYVGLDYAALREVRLHLGLRPGPELLNELQTMERFARQALNEADDD